MIRSGPQRDWILSGWRARTGSTCRISPKQKLAAPAATIQKPTQNWPQRILNAAATQQRTHPPTQPQPQRSGAGGAVAGLSRAPIRRAFAGKQGDACLSERSERVCIAAPRTFAGSGSRRPRTSARLRPRSCQTDPPAQIPAQSPAPSIPHIPENTQRRAPYRGTREMQARISLQVARPHGSGPNRR